MKRFVSRITLVALVAATCTPTAYSLNPIARDGLIFAALGAALTAAGIAGLWHGNRQDKAQLDADFTEYQNITNDLPILKAEKEKKPAFCKLKDSGIIQARRAAYEQKHSAAKAFIEAGDYAALNATISKKEDRQAELNRALIRHSNDDLRGLSILGVICGLGITACGLVNYFDFRHY